MFKTVRVISYPSDERQVRMKGRRWVDGEADLQVVPVQNGVGVAQHALTVLLSGIEKKIKYLNKGHFWKSWLKSPVYFMRKLKKAL